MRELHQEVVERGREIFRLMEEATPHLFDSRRWTGMLMAAAMADPEMKVRLFRFVDVLPVLSTRELLVEHLREYFLDQASPLPPFLRTFLRGLDSPATAWLTASLVRRNIVSLARTFIAGETTGEAIGELERIWRNGGTCTVDMLGEAALSEDEAECYRDAYRQMIGLLAGEMARWPASDRERESLFPRLNVSVKVSSLFSRFGPLNHEESVSLAGGRLRPILRAARKAGGFVNLDMEMRSLKDLTIDLFTGIMDEEEFQGWDGAGVALQAYLPETWDDLQRLASWASDRRRRLTIRLVKGAYWEYENVVARQKGWPVPVYRSKDHTDWNFERCTAFLFERHACLVPALGTHNVRSIAAALVLADRYGIRPAEYEFQMLYGMAEPIKEALRHLGHPVREYVPVGELIPGMAYLVRRLLENSSNEGFLRRTFLEMRDRDQLLQQPNPPSAEPELPTAGDGFRNEPPRDFSRAEHRIACRNVLSLVRSGLGREWPALVAGRECRTGEAIISENPTRPTEVVGRVTAVDRGLVEEALLSACRAQAEWGGTSPAGRAAVLFRAAEIARTRRETLLAWQLLETGKGWVEADADVVEAIDHLEYYGREMLRLGEPRRLGDVPGEENRYVYHPRGVALVISPWNFPLAIPAGMIGAALAAGNSVLFKPSSLSPVTGRLLVDIFREAGLPNEVLHFVPGRGDEIGDYLVGHKDVDVIAFTGSRQTGLSLLEKAARQFPGQRAVKRVIAEMGGKNAIVVDDDADLDQAVSGVLLSAFGYQGQKCSACSRAIVLTHCYDRFLDRLAAAMKGLVIGSPEDPATGIGPLISAASRDRFDNYLAIARREGGDLITGGEPPREGYFVSPALVAGLPADSSVLKEEIFGPLLAVQRAGDLEEAIAMVNDSDYALTGGIYSRSPAGIRLAVERIAVGNLYINRPITGAVVGRQPFGGFRLSGIGSKAGGPDYLRQFLEPRVVTENTLRRGFAPDVIS